MEQTETDGRIAATAGAIINGSNIQFIQKHLIMLYTIWEKMTCEKLWILWQEHEMWGNVKAQRRPLRRWKKTVERLSVIDNKRLDRRDLRHNGRYWSYRDRTQHKVQTEWLGHSRWLISVHGSMAANQIKVIKVSFCTDTRHFDMHCIPTPTADFIIIWPWLLCVWPLGQCMPRSGHTVCVYQVCCW